MEGNENPRILKNRLDIVAVPKVLHRPVMVLYLSAVFVSVSGMACFVVPVLNDDGEDEEDDEDEEDEEDD